MIAIQERFLLNHRQLSVSRAQASSKTAIRDRFRVEQVIKIAYRLPILRVIRRIDRREGVRLVLLQIEVAVELIGQVVRDLCIVIRLQGKKM